MQLPKENGMDKPIVWANFTMDNIITMTTQSYR